VLLRFVEVVRRIRVNRFCRVVVAAVCR